MRIVFMGTPDFALFSLKALVEAGEEVVGVVTQPDKPRGRGYVLTPPPVKVYAIEQNIPVYQPTTLKNGAFDDTLRELNPELIVLNGFMLQLGDYFLNQLETAIRENVLSVAGDFEIRISESLATILPLGAVAEICNSYLRSDDFKWIYQLQRNGDEQ